jgi:hypothetical protein
MSASEADIFSNPFARHPLDSTSAVPFCDPGDPSMNPQHVIRSSDAPAGEAT